MRLFAETGRREGLQGNLIDRLRIMLGHLAAIDAADDLKVPPNFGAHLLTGDRAGMWSLTVTKNWRTTFRLSGRGDRGPRSGGLPPMPIKLHPSFAVHPGVWLRAEMVEPHGPSVTQAAAQLRVTRQAMSNLLGGRAGLSAETAIRFEEALGLSADTLTRLQAAHDLAEVRRRENGI